MKQQEKFNLHANTAEGLIFIKIFYYYGPWFEMKEIEIEKGGKGVKDGSKEASQAKTRKKQQPNIRLKVKASNNSGSHYINYTGGCSGMYLQSNVRKPQSPLLSPLVSSLCMTCTHSNGITENHLVSPGDQGASMRGRHCFPATPAESHRSKQFVFMNTDTEVFMCYYVSACLFYVCVCSI